MRIALLGDIALLGNFSLTKNPDLLKNLKDVSEYLSGFDFVIGNLETPFSRLKRKHGAKSAYLQTDVENIDVLKALNLSAVSIANNHIFDYGKEGYSTTVRLLEDNGIDWFGANGKDFRIEKDGNNIIFNGFCCYSTNPLKIAKKYGQEGLNPFDYAEASRLLEKNHKKGWLNIFSVHSGEEHVNTPSLPQVKASRQLADKAPYIFYGHHPHVIQGIEEYKDTLIAHSLGNFCFSGLLDEKKKIVYPLSDNNRLGMILEIELSDNKILHFIPRLVEIDEDGKLSIKDDNGIIRDYSDQLKDAHHNPDFYSERRRKQRHEYISKRKEIRNLKWYLKRMRPRYFKLLLTNKSNAGKYKRNVLDHVKTPLK